MAKLEGSEFGFSYTTFLWLLASIGFLCSIYLTHHYYQFYASNSPSQKTVSVTTNSSIHSFPLSSCGDRSAGGTNTWYPVFVKYNNADLARIRKYFCCDAFYNSSLNRIQVASFYSRDRANKFARILRNKNFSTAKVGRGKTVTTVPSKTIKNNCK